MTDAHNDYDVHMPPGCEAGRTAGLRLIRVAARALAEYGRSAVGPLHLAMGRQIFDTASDGRPVAAGLGERGSFSSRFSPRPAYRSS
jgi:hypothetical protein